MKSYFLLFIIILSIVLTNTIIAQIPRTLSYQGVLTDPSGKPRPDGSYNFIFKFWNDSSGGQLLWSSTPKTIGTNRGLFSTVLGDAPPFPDSLRFDCQYWLEIKVNDSTLSPRILLTSVGYSMSALRADTAKVAIVTAHKTGWAEYDSNPYTLGNVGIGTGSDNRYKLFIAGANPQLVLRDTIAGVNQGIHVNGRGLGLGFDGGGALWVDRVTGHVSIGAYPSDRSRLFISGDAPQISLQGGISPNDYIQGIGVNSTGLSIYYDQGPALTIDRASGHTITKVLEITGGSDLAEPFEITNNKTLPAGTVVIIDPDHQGKLTQSTQAYDRRVAGIISGAGGINPGLTLNQQETFKGGQHVALSGKVYVRATASNGKITPGDLLTTSDLPGHAMKASDEKIRYGVTIGKAMSSLDNGEGLVLVLVNLQ